MAVVSLARLLGDLRDLKRRNLLKIVVNFELTWVLYEFSVVILAKVAWILVGLLVLANRLHFVGNRCSSFCRYHRLNLIFSNLAHLLFILATWYSNMRDPCAFRFLWLWEAIQEKLFATKIAWLASMALSSFHVGDWNKRVPFGGMLRRQSQHTTFIG